MILHGDGDAVILLRLEDSPKLGVTCHQFALLEEIRSMITDIGNEPDINAAAESSLGGASHACACN